MFERYETFTAQVGQLLAVLFVAFFCGAALGLERELRRKHAGLKTIVLICMGSAIYAALARLMLADAGAAGQDPTRVAGQVITGVGFIGGGAILQAGGTVMGLTSAAVIWTAAGIGLFVGSGYPLLALVITITVVSMLVALRIAEERFLRRVVGRSS
ncbi:MAG: MgtC/SapB family protein [Deltaproteobacteria bacterium]|nr:MAG: MgtC/SapB family protein [Deltaproteobacteria bacterium]TMB06070.1 MAG: MgtC/SapB family protein [Deltaproteobacteria bacterium]